MKVMNISWWELFNAFLDMDFLLGQIVCFIPPVCSVDVFQRLLCVTVNYRNSFPHTAEVLAAKTEQGKIFSDMPPDGLLPQWQH